MQGRTAATPLLPLPRRGGALALTAGIHLLALFLFLRPAEPMSQGPEVRTLSVFDLPLPPSPSPEAPPPPVEAPAAGAPAGGSPGIARQRPSERVIVPDVAPATVDVTRVVEAPPMPQPTTGGAAPTVNEGAGSDGLGTGLGSGTGSGAGSGGGGTPAVTLGHAEWVTRPTEWDFRREWPFRGRDVDARVVLSCRVRRGNRPYGCSVLHEVPAGLGFGQAAIRLTYRSRIRPVQRNARDWYDLPVTVPFQFRQRLKLKPSEMPVSEEAPAPSP